MTEKEQGGYAERMFAREYVGLVSVIPPNAQLTPGSKIPQNALGKVPGIRKQSGRWSGYGWRKHTATLDEVRAWDRSGANIGIRADLTPACDIDCTDPALVALIRDIATTALGAAPVRVGRAPKCVLMYRTAEPFGRMRLWIDDRRHLVEILGVGNQYVIHGTHPVTGGSYVWDRSPDNIDLSELTTITRDQASAFLDAVALELTARGVGKLEREGDGRAVSRSEVEQTALLAPSIELLTEAVRAIPNTSKLFPSRTDYLRIGYAIRAAAGEANAAGAFELFADWAARWDEGTNNPEVVREDWERMRGPYTVGWAWLAEQARGFGFNDAALDFDVVEGATAGGPPEHIARFNQQYATLRTASSSILYTPRGRDGQPMQHMLMPLNGWRTNTANQRVLAAKRSGKGVESRAISDLWLEDPVRRDYEGLVFNPKLPPRTDVPSAIPGAKDYNIWPGFPLAPSDAGSCSLFLKHVREVVCCGDSGAYEWVMQWLANIVQSPADKPGTALVLIGIEGTGKSLVPEVMSNILGDQLFTKFKGAEGLTGRFNVQAEAKLLAEVEEAVFAGNKGAVGHIKQIITSSRLPIERKGVDVIVIDNLLRLLFTSNESWAINIGQNARRFTVLEVSSAYANDRVYFGALRKQMFNEGGCARLLQHLMFEVNIDSDFIGLPFKTDALRDQQLHSLAAEKRWLYEVLMSGVLPSAPIDGIEPSGAAYLYTDDVFAHYSLAMQRMGERQRVKREVMGKVLVGHGVGTTDKRGQANKKRAVYIFPALSEIRRRFAKSLATAPAWDEVNEWQSADLLLDEALV